MEVKYNVLNFLKELCSKYYGNSKGIILAIGSERQRSDMRILSVRFYKMYTGSERYWKVSIRACSGSWLMWTVYKTKDEARKVVL